VVEEETVCGLADTGAAGAGVPLAFLAEPVHGADAEVDRGGRGEGNAVPHAGDATYLLLRQIRYRGER
jgi:hypothetical protein